MTQQVKKPMKITLTVNSASDYQVAIENMMPIPAGRMSKMIGDIHRYYRKQMKQLRIDQRKEAFANQQNEPAETEEKSEVTNDG